MHEWPLLIFTLLLQGAVGLTLLLIVSACPGNTQGLTAAQSTTTMRVPLFVICVLAGLGLLASIFHLGYPLHAFNALRHIASSWLSREIVFASLFLAASGLCFLAAWCRRSWWKALLPLALLLGLIDVFCMSKIYMQTSVVTWAHANTLVMFYGSVGIIGAVASSGLLPWRNTTLPRWSVGVIAAVVLVRLVAQIPYMAWLADAGLNDAQTFPHQPLVSFRALETLRLWGWGLSVIGALAFAMGTLRRRSVWLCVGGVLLLAAEILLRYAFFSIH